MRPKEFNRNSVLEKCIILFWKEGFTTTGIEKIVEHTGVNRYSLYQEFGNKDGILLASFELYQERNIPFDLLTSTSLVNDSLFRFYSSFFHPSTESNYPVGCYISTLAMELREKDAMKEYFNNFQIILKSKFDDFLELVPGIDQSDAKTISENLTFYYSTSIAMYVIFPIEETEKYLRNNLKIITKCLDK
jgi:TetR/AcrR family transcriptional repressor of nem operon